MKLILTALLGLFAIGGLDDYVDFKPYFDKVRLPQTNQVRGEGISTYRVDQSDEGLVGRRQ